MIGMPRGSGSGLGTLMKTFANITVIGRDKTGVVARITQALFQTGANIEEIEQQVARGQFSMFLQCSWPIARLQRSSVEQMLQNLGRLLKMEIRTRFVQFWVGCHYD